MLTIAQIVEQALAAQGAHEAKWFEPYRSVTSIECARAACLAVAKAVVEQFKLRLAEKYDARGPTRFLENYDDAMHDCRAVYESLRDEVAAQRPGGKAGR